MLIRFSTLSSECLTIYGLQLGSALACKQNISLFMVTEKWLLMVVVKSSLTYVGSDMEVKDLISPLLPYHY